MVAFKSLMITAALFSVVSAIPSWRINVKDADVSASGDAPAPPATTAVVVAPVSDAATSPQPDDLLAPAPAPPVAPEKVLSDGALSDLAISHMPLILLGSVSLTFATLL